MTSDDDGSIEIKDDNRNFYRLNGIIGVACFSTAEEFAEELTDPYDARLGVPPILSLLNQSRENQVDSNNLLKQIRGRNGMVGRYLERLNERLDFLQKSLLYVDKSFPELLWQVVEYSEAGLTFFAPKFPGMAEQHRVHLLLGVPAPGEEPEDTGFVLPQDHEVYSPQFSPKGYISVISRVTQISTAQSSVATKEPELFKYGCAFEIISEFDRQFLARHILAVQSFRRRKSLS